MHVGGDEVLSRGPYRDGPVRAAGRSVGRAQGFLTKEALESIARTTLDNIREFEVCMRAAP